MAEMLLLNPVGRRRKRRKGVSSRRRRNPVGAVARRRVRRNPVASLARRRARRNPIAGLSRRARRRMNPIGRRRRNPIGGKRLSTSAVVRMLTDAAVGAAGAIGVDLAWNKINAKLPATLRTGAQLGVGDAVKALATAVLGIGLSRMTKGYSVRMASGALTVQLRDVALRQMARSGVAGLGYYSPAPVVQGQARIGPNAAMQTGGAVGAYLRPGAQTPLLSGTGAYMAPGRTALLSGAGTGVGSASRRERVSNWR